MTYTERLNWWWVARRAYQSQEDFAAGKVAAEGVSCKYGIPGFLPGTCTPYSKPVTNPDTSTPDEVTPANPTEESTTEDGKLLETPPPAETEEVTTTEEANSSDDTKTDHNPGTVNLIIPPGSSTLNVISNRKKHKNKNTNKPKH